MRRLFIDESLAPEIVIKGQDAVHLLYAMRARPGQIVTVSDKNGQTAKTVIKLCESDKVILALLEKLSHTQESPIKTVLFQCLPKADKMEYIVQKTVELGVSKIVPVTSHNCVVKYDAAKKEKKKEKWQKISDEAAKQCAREIIPEVCSITDFTEAVKQAAQYTACVCYENEKTLPLKKYLCTQDSPAYAILIGPEGGFTETEIDQCSAAGIKSISLGRRILRTETAAVTSLSILQYEKGDLGN